MQHTIVRWRITLSFTCLVLLSLLMAACAPVQPAAPAAGGEAAASSAKKVVLIGNQRFGDQGPMDDMAAGLDKCASDYGLEVKKLESESAAEHAEDIRAMASEGYNLIMTTFPPMTEPTKEVAKEFPDTQFLGIYQFINVGDEKFANIYDTEYRGQEALYVMGAIAATLTKSKKVGYIAGAEEPSINNEMNGFIKGYKETCPDCSVEVGFVGSFEDPATAKEIAKAMFSRGVDLIETGAAKSQLGVIEAAKETGNLVIGDVADNNSMYPEGFAGFIGVSFAANVIEGCRLFAEGKLPGGDHGFMNLANRGYYVPWEAFERFGKASADHADAVGAAVKLGKELEAKFNSGELKVEFNPETPQGQ